jgi:hypothetical protein
MVTQNRMNTSSVVIIIMATMAIPAKKYINRATR